MYSIDDIDKKIINNLQGGFPICAEPYKIMANSLGICSVELRYRLENLIRENVITRFGPMYQIEKIGGTFTLCAMKIPENEIENVSRSVNSLKEVAHNYLREHELNMWFVLATESPTAVQESITRIESLTGHKVFNMPKEREYFVEARFTA